MAEATPATADTALSKQTGTASSQHHVSVLKPGSDVSELLSGPAEQVTQVSGMHMPVSLAVFRHPARRLLHISRSCSTTRS